MTPQSFSPFAVPAPPADAHTDQSSVEPVVWTLADLRTQLLWVATTYLETEHIERTGEPATHLGVAPTVLTGSRPDRAGATNIREVTLAWFLDKFRAARDAERLQTVAFARYQQCLSCNVLDRIIADILAGPTGIGTLAGVESLTLGQATDCIESLGNPTAAAPPSPPPGGANQSALNTSPPYPAPAEDKIEAAARDLTDVLGDLSNSTKFANERPTGPHRLVLAADLVGALAECKGHTKAAAAHALHRLVTRGLLSAEIAIKPKWSITVGGRSEEMERAVAAIESRPFDRSATEPTTTAFPARPLYRGDGPVPYEHLLVRSTDALWEANRKRKTEWRDSTSDSSRTVVLGVPTELPLAPEPNASTFQRLIFTLDTLHSLAMNSLNLVGQFRPVPSVLGGPHGFDRSKATLPRVAVSQTLRSKVQQLREDAEQLLTVGRQSARAHAISFETIRRDFDQVRRVIAVTATIALDPLDETPDLPLSHWATVRGTLDDYDVHTASIPVRSLAGEDRSRPDAEGSSTGEGGEATISVVDLPGIGSAIRDLYRAIDTPPRDPFVPPAWWGRLPKELNLTLPNPGPPAHAWLIHCAMRWVSLHLAAGRLDQGDECPTVVESELAVPQKAKLVDLWRELRSPLVSAQLASTKGDATRFKAFLLEVLAVLESGPAVTAPVVRQSANDRHAAKVIEDINSQTQRFYDSLPKAETPEQESKNAWAMMRYHFERVRPWADMEEMSRNLAEKGITPPWFSQPEWETLARSVGADPGLPLHDIYTAAMAWATEKQNLERIRLSASREQPAAPPVPLPLPPKPGGDRKSKGGRPADTDKVLEKRIVEAWKTGRFKRYADLARELSIPVREVKWAVDRSRKPNRNPS